ncbi:MAG: aminoglycoside phosphotransferase family protein [Parvibaculaceae bacterium]
MSDEFLAQVKTLLVANGESVDGFSARPCREGGNNLVYEITLANKSLLAKQYYRSPEDPRDRLATEWAFIAYATSQRIANVPAPVVSDAINGIALYQFVEGRKLSGSELQVRHIDAAADFFLALNGPDRAERAAAVPVASEACFSITDHCALIDRRVARLAAIEGDDDLEKEAKARVAEICEIWRSTKKMIEATLAKDHLDPDALLSSSQRCLSPSDFGYHNALLRADGGVTFIDFEYAGWDDPAKMAADFFCQPQVPVDHVFFERFLDLTMSFSADAEVLKRRTRLILPAQKLKWACIMLNDFLPDAARRRRFANPEAEKSQRKRAQLDKVGAALAALKT